MSDARGGMGLGCARHVALAGTGIFGGALCAATWHSMRPLPQEFWVRDADLAVADVRPAPVPVFTRPDGHLWTSWAWDAPAPSRPHWLVDREALTRRSDSLGLLGAVQVGLPPQYDSRPARLRPPSMLSSGGWHCFRLRPDGYSGQHTDAELAE